MQNDPKKAVGMSEEDATKLWQKLNDEAAKKTKSGIMSGVGQAIKDITTSQPDILGKYDQKEFFGLEDSVITLQNVFNITEDIKLLKSQTLEYFREEAQIQNTINSNLGLTGDLAESVKSSIQDTLPAALKLGYGIDQLNAVYTNLNDQTGRFNVVSKQILLDSLDTSRAFVGDLSEMGKVYGEFEKVGIGFRDTLDDINEIGLKSTSIGLTGKKTVADVRENLDKLNQYGFKNGIQGLAEMSRMGKMFRMDMQSAFSVAEKVMDPANAIEMSANLQVLGGAVGDFANPLKLMYDATNDVGGIQKSIIEAAKSLAVYNAEEGRFAITGANLRRAREMAQITGIDYKELEKGAIAANERVAGLQQLMSTGFQGNKDDKDFLLNLARMEKGQMMITIPENLKDKFGEFGKQGQIAFKDLTKEYSDLILGNKKYFEKLTPAQIAEGQLTELQQINRNIASIAATTRNRIGQSIKGGVGEGLKVNEQFALANNKLGQAANSLIKYGDSGGKFEGKMAENMKTVVKDILGENASTISNVVKKVDESLGLTGKNDFKLQAPLNRFTDTEERRAQNLSNKINDSYKTTEKTVTNNTETQKTQIEVVHTFGPTDSISNSIYRETIKNHGIRQQLQETPDKRDFDYLQYAKRGGKKG